MDAKISPPGLLANWIGPIVFLLLGAALFGSGYWLGHRSVLDSKPAQAVSTSRPPWNPGPNAGAASPITSPFNPVIPSNASPEMKEFMQNRATLNAKMAEMRASGNGVPNPQGFAQFQKDNADLLARQKELGQIIAQQQAKNPMSAPPPLQIPPNASPQLKAFLTARDQLMRDQITFMNEHRTDDPAKRQEAMKQWREQNAARFAQLQQDEKAVAENKPTTSAKQPSTSASAPTSSSTSTK